MGEELRCRPLDIQGLAALHPVKGAACSAKVFAIRLASGHRYHAVCAYLQAHRDKNWISSKRGEFFFVYEAEPAPCG
jgi:hypothetical protein